MATIKNSIVSYNDGQVSVWYEYDDVAMEVTTLGVTTDGTPVNISYVAKNASTRTISSTTSRSVSIPSNLRPKVTNLLRNGRTVLDGFDATVSIG